MNREKLISKYIEGDIILDFGSAGFSNFLHTDLINYTGKKIIGVDIEKNEQVDIVADLSKEVPIESNYADTIIASEVIEHLDNPFNLVREAYRILKKGGVFILTTPNPTGLPQILHNDISKDRLQFSKDQITKAVEEEGFKIIKYFKPLEAYRFNFIAKGLTLIFPKLRITHFVICRK